MKIYVFVEEKFKGFLKGWKGKMMKFLRVYLIIGVHFIVPTNKKKYTIEIYLSAKTGHDRSMNFGTLRYEIQQW